MSFDFTFSILESLFTTLRNRGFLFCTLQEYASLPLTEARVVIVRHDVEDNYFKALNFARIEHRQGIKGSYYFRLFPVSGNDRIISQIAALGHEVGYHYDDLSECQGNYQKALERFEKNLSCLRQFAPVSTMTMEGAPLSKYDNRQLWLGRYDELTNSHHSSFSPPSSTPRFQSTIPPRYNYRDFGILCEPYFDINFVEMFYLTDTGRRWDGWKASVRDKMPQQAEWVKQGLIFHSTRDIIAAANAGKLPDKIMMTFHPQRWNNQPLLWLKELVWQGVKNQGKRILVKAKSK